MQAADPGSVCGPLSTAGCGPKHTQSEKKLLGILISNLTKCPLGASLGTCEIFPAESVLSLLNLTERLA